MNKENFHYHENEFTDLNSLYEYLLNNYKNLESLSKDLMSKVKFREWLKSFTNDNE